MNDASLRPEVTALLPLTDSSLWARVAALLPYHIGGIAYDDITKTKTLYTALNANSDSPKPFLDNDNGNPYRVPSGKVFVVGRVSFYLNFDTATGYAGEANSSGGSIVNKVLAMGVGTGEPALKDILGWFGPLKFVSAASRHYDKDLRAPCYLYGVEIATTPTININFTTGEHTTEDYSEIKTLWMSGQATDTSPKSLKRKDGEYYIVPAGKQFIAGLVQYHLDRTDYTGRIGESDAQNGAITKEVLSLPTNSQKPDLIEVLGVFSAGKYITAETSAWDKPMLEPTFLYGVEVDA